jgi:hypothetical protein
MYIWDGKSFHSRSPSSLQGIFASGFLVQVYIYTHQLCLATFDSKRQRTMMYIDHPAMGFVCLWEQCHVLHIGLSTLLWTKRGSRGMYVHKYINITTDPSRTPPLPSRKVLLPSGGRGHVFYDFSFRLRWVFSRKMARTLGKTQSTFGYTFAFFVCFIHLLDELLDHKNK